jgi:hypothetical protein
VKRFLDSSTSQPEVLTCLNDRPTSTQPGTTSLGITTNRRSGALSGRRIGDLGGLRGGRSLEQTAQMGVICIWPNRTLSRDMDFCCPLAWVSVLASSFRLREG